MLSRPTPHLDMQERQKSGVTVGKPCEGESSEVVQVIGLGADLGVRYQSRSSDKSLDGHSRCMRRKSQRHAFALAT